MNLPRKWNVLSLDSTRKFYYGVDFATDSWHYSLYVTDFSHVWICDVDEQKLHFKAMQNGIEQDSIGSVYRTLIKSFENNFSSDETETKISMEELKVDKGVPLELKLNMVRIYSNADLNWSFDLVILPDSSAITIMRNLMFHLSTIIFSLDAYKEDLIKVIEHKDSAIRFLGETIEGMNGGHLITKWAPQNSSNSRVLRSFDHRIFDQTWKEKKLAQIEDKYIWDVLDTNSAKSTWDYSTTFQDQPESEPLKEEKKKPLNDSFEDYGDDDFVNLEDQDDTDDSGLDSLHINDNKTETIKNSAHKRGSETDTDSSRASSKGPFASNSATPSPTKEHAPSQRDSTPSQSASAVSEAPSKSQSPSKPTRHFGSRKRKISHTGFSPIKAPKRSPSKD